MTNVPPGWLPDPMGRHEVRYWDGTNWSDQVANGGVAATDPVGPSGEVPATIPQGVAPSGPSPYGLQPEAMATSSGGVPGQAPSSGPSTGLLIGLGILVVGLVAAIAVVLVAGDDDGDDSEQVVDTSDTTTPPTTTPTTTEPVDDVDEVLDDDPLGLEPMVDSIILDFQGLIDEDEARCMVREAAIESLDRDVDMTADFETLPVEDQSAIMFAMLDECVEVEAVMSGLMAVGMQDAGLSEEEADCAATGIVDEIGAEALLQAIAEAGAGDPIQQLPAEDQNAVEGIAIGCLL